MIEQRVLEQLLCLREAARGHPNCDVRAAIRFALGTLREHNRMPKRHAQVTPRFIDVRFTIDVEFKQPLLAHHKQQLVHVGRVIIDHLEDVARHEAFVAVCVGHLFVPRCRNLLQTVFGKHALDGFAHFDRHRDEQPLPTVDENVDPRVFRIRANSDAHVFEQNLFVLVPRAEKLNERHGLFAEIRVDRAVGIARTDLDNWRDFLRQEVERGVYERTKAFVAHDRVKDVGVRFFFRAFLKARGVALDGLLQARLRNPKWELIRAERTSLKRSRQAEITHGAILADRPRGTNANSCNLRVRAHSSAFERTHSPRYDASTRGSTRSFCASSESVMRPVSRT